MFFKDLRKKLTEIFSYAPLEYMKRLKRLVIISILIGCVEIFVAGMVSLMGVALATPSTIANSSLIRLLVEKYPFLNSYFHDSIFLLATILILLIVGMIMKNILLALIQYKQTLFSFNLISELSSKLIYCYLNRNYQWHLNNNSSDGQSLFIYRFNVVNYINNSITLFTQIIISCLLLITGLILAPLASITVFGITGVTAILIYKMSRRQMNEHNTQIVNIDMFTNKIALSARQGVREVKIYQKENILCEKINEQLHQVSKHYAVSHTLKPLPAWAIETVGMATLLIALILMYSLNFPVAYIMGSITLLAAMAWRLLPCMNKAVTAVMTIQADSPYVRKFMNDMYPIDIHKTPSSESLSFNNEIIFSKLFFKYPDAKNYAISNIDISIKKGQSVGIVGRSGSGKSSLVNILIGLLKAESGIVYLDSNNIDLNNLYQLSSITGYVPQSPFIFDGTLAENIAFKDFGQNIDRKQIEEVCRLASIDFIEQLENGFDTNIGERGVKLSGGQIQRIAIARALYANPQIIIFDEATSALDGASEFAIQQTISKLQDSMTVIIIAHRLSTVENCDLIYWLDKGKIVSSGKAASVLEQYKNSLLSY